MSLASNKNEPSEEQQNIIDSMLSGNSVVVNAVAGSGKSTTILFLADSMPPDKKILQVTYNAQLRHEVKEKVEERGLTNLVVHTYHSLAVRYYSPLAHTDTELRRILRLNAAPVGLAAPCFDVLIIDEAQDMTPLYYHFFKKWMRDFGAEGAQMMVLGDEKQGLYEFKGSDTRFLTLAPRIWGGGRTFVAHELRTSYRVTNEMAAFVNEVMLGEPRLRACRQGAQVVYVRKHVFEARYTLMHMILKMLDDPSGANRPDDFFILCGSLKNSVRKWENLLVNRGIPCYLPTMEMEGLDERIIRGKVVFSTFHSVKGRQRKHVFVVGFDESYFDYYARDASRTECPNTLYVGCTRATETLVLMEKDNHYEDGPLPFLKRTHAQMRREPWIDFRGKVKALSWSSAEEKKENNNGIKKISNHFLTPTELIKFVPDETMEILAAKVDALFERESEWDEVELEIPVVIETQRGFHEDVSDLNGTVLPFLYLNAMGEGGNEEEYNDLYSLVEKAMRELPAGEYEFLKESFATLEYTGSTADHLYLANLYAAWNEKLYYRLRQIGRDEYTWLSENIIELCVARLGRVLGSGGTNNCPICDAERTIIHAGMELETARIQESLEAEFPDRRFFFTARVDMVVQQQQLIKETVWEWKCTSHLTIDHFLQVVIYAWLMTTASPIPLGREFKIFNIKTGQKFRLGGAVDDWREIVVILLRKKYERAERMDTAEFMEKFGNGGE
jgi:hypothetical protein